MKHAVRALRHRNFALFLVGQGVSLAGYWIQQLALVWLMYRLTGSALLLGMVSFASNIPILLLAPFAGIVSDRFNLQRMMVLIQALEMLQAVTLTVLALTGLIQPWHILALALFMGICVAFELPVRHAFMPDLVGNRDDLPNAIALTSFVSNGGRLIGPSIAGVVIALFSEGVCFLINSATYLVVLWSLVVLRVPRRAPAQRSMPMWQGLKEGAVYAWGSLPIRMLLLTVAVVSFMAMPYGTLLPVIVREIYHGDARMLGFLAASAGGGAFIGTGYLAARSGVRGLTVLIAGAVAIAGGALVLFSFSKMFWVSVPLLMITGFGILATTVSVSMIIQTIVEDDKRGRVMSLYTVAFLGVSPLGALAAGALAEVIGAARTVLLGGSCCLIMALILARSQRILAAHMRPVFQRLGIIEK